MRGQDFRAISIRQPWADLILRGVKDIENRSRPTRFRGWVLVHAGLRINRAALEESAVRRGLARRGRDGDYQPDTGAILGMVEIVDCVDWHRSSWFGGPWGYVLARPVRFARPIPFLGQLGFFRVRVRRLRGTRAAAVTPGGLR